MPINWWVDKQNVIYSYNGILLSNKNEQYSDNHLSKKARHKKSVYLWFCLYQVLEDSKLIYINNCKSNGCPGEWRGVDWVKGEWGNFLGDRNVLYCDRVISYTGCKVYTFGKVQRIALKFSIFNYIYIILKLVKNWSYENQGHLNTFNCMNIISQKSW